LHTSNKKSLDSKDTPRSAGVKKVSVVMTEEEFKVEAIGIEIEEDGWEDEIVVEEDRDEERPRTGSIEEEIVVDV
jgi:hypothetical protein